MTTLNEVVQITDDVISHEVESLIASIHAESDTYRGPNYGGLRHSAHWWEWRRIHHGEC